MKQREEQTEQWVIEIIRKMGIDITKEGLIKALQYDRNQYEKGYQDGLNADKWIEVDDNPPEEPGEYLILWTTSISKRKFIEIAECEIIDNHIEWLLDDYMKNYPDVKVIAWQPLPSMPKEENL